jgi:tyrosine-protein kinase Etk/Wzc
MNDKSQSDNLNKSFSSAQTQEEGLNLKVIIGKFLAFVPYFVLSLMISLGIAFLVNRYSNPRYMVKATMLIKEKNSRGGMDGADGFLQGMQLLNTSKNIENELGIIRSRGMVLETIKKLDFGISYFSIGAIKKTDLYGSSPFTIMIDSSHLQIVGGELMLSLIGNGEVQVYTEDPVSVFVPKTGEIVQSKIELPKQNFKLQNEIVSDYYKFNIQFNDPSLLQQKDVVYSFKLNTLEATIGQYVGSYVIKPVNKQSSIVEITKEGNWPEKDIAFINKLCATYTNKGLDEKNKTTQNTIAFIDSQLGNISDSLNLVEDQLQIFRSDNRIVDLSATGINIVTQIGDLEKTKAEEELKAKYYEYLRKYVQANKGFDELVAPSSMGIQDPLLNTILTKMMETYAKKKTLEISLKESNPMIQETNNTFLVLKETLQENLKNLIASHQLVLNDLNSRIAQFETQIGGLPQKEQKLLKMTRKYQLSDKLYTYLLEKRAEAGIAGAGITPDSKIIDAAIVSEQVYPKKSNNYSIALLVGLIIPLAIILGLEFFNNTIHNHVDLQKVTQIPLLGSIVHNTKSTALVIANHPKSQVSEAFRNLRSNISFLAGTKVNKKVIMVTSTVSGEGKTFISMNLSSVLAIGGYRTLLIGVDLRKPKIFQDFKLDNSFGLTNYLIGKADKEKIVQKTELANLDIITAGPTPPNPSELIMSAAFYNLLEEYKKEYDYIILDTPPIGLVADGLDIMKHSDIVFYVARQNISKKNYFNMINEIYANEKEKNIGLIFNDVNFAAVYGYGYGAYGYGYGYGYGSGYGGGYGYGYGSGYGYGYGNGYGGYGDTEVEKKPLWKRILGR